MNDINPYAAKDAAYQRQIDEQAKQEQFWMELLEDSEAINTFAADFVEDGIQPNFCYGPELILRFDELMELVDLGEFADMKKPRFSAVQQKLKALLIIQAEKLIIQHCEKQLGGE